MNYFEEYTTQFVQSIGSKEGAISPEIINSASFGYGDPQTAEGIFNGSVQKPLYSRMGNPTSAKLEKILAEMDGGVGAVVTASGMAATTLATMSLLSAGDEVISIGGLFGGTYSFFNETIRRFGVTTNFFDVDEFEEIENAITGRTKIIFLESVGNPNMRLPDFSFVANLAKKHNIVLIVDNTTTPLSLAPIKLGADIVVYSTTKIISGNASVLGGAVVFRAIDDGEDKFRTDKYSDIHKFINKAGKMGLIVNAKKRAMRDFGLSSSAFASYLTLLGLETLPLRLERIRKSVERIVATLNAKGYSVNHPSLPLHPHHERYNITRGCGSLFTLDLQTKERAFEFLEKSKLVTITANIGDSRTLALHMASTIYSDFDEKTRKFLGITDGLIRISVGLENPDDILADFEQALN